MPEQEQLMGDGVNAQNSQNTSDSNQTSNAVFQETPLESTYSVGLQGIVTQTVQPIETQEIKGTPFYHPSWISKIFSGILWFYGAIMLYCGILNLSLITNEGVSLIKIMLVGGGFILYGALEILLGLLFYCKKRWIHLGVSFLIGLSVSIFGGILLNVYGGDFIDEFENFPSLIGFFTQLYFLLVTIVWCIRYFRFKKKGKGGKKMLDSTSSGKKLSIATFIVLLLILVANLIYGKMYYLKVPDVDVSGFYRTEHQKKLPEGEDGVSILKAMEGDSDLNNIWYILDRIYSMESIRGYKEFSGFQLGWQWHPDECIKVYSGDQASCGTWAWKKSTLKRLLRHKFYKSGYGGSSDDFYTIDGKEVTVLEYLENHESEIGEKLEELDRLLSMDYYIPSDGFYLDGLPQNFQMYARGSVVLLQYYTLKGDWDKVLLIANINYKMSDVASSFGGFVGVLISTVISNIFNEAINSSVQIFPEEFRLKLVKWYEEHNIDEQTLQKRTTEGEFGLGAYAIKELKNEMVQDIGLMQLTYHYPFYYKKDTKKYFDYFYSVFNRCLVLGCEAEDEVVEYLDSIYDRKSIYNYRGVILATQMFPRLSGARVSVKRGFLHREAVMANLKSGSYEKWYNEPNWEADKDMYNTYAIVDLSDEM